VVTSSVETRLRAVVDVVYGLVQSGCEQVPYADLESLLHGPDLAGAELDLAIRVQPLLMLLERHLQLRASAVDEVATSAANEGDGLLTCRQLAVLQLLADGLTAVAIGRRLGTSPRTVHKHLEHIYRKLGASDRVTAVRIGLTRGLIEAA
jgi:DNA-binding CsgD family transcriptional regulator